MWRGAIFFVWMWWFYCCCCCFVWNVKYQFAQNFQQSLNQLWSSNYLYGLHISTQLVTESAIVVFEVKTNVIIAQPCRDIIITRAFIILSLCTSKLSSCMGKWTRPRHLLHPFTNTNEASLGSILRLQSVQCKKFAYWLTSAQIIHDSMQNRPKNRHSFVHCSNHYQLQTPSLSPPELKYTQKHAKF